VQTDTDKAEKYATRYQNNNNNKNHKATFRARLPTELTISTPQSISTFIY